MRISHTHKFVIINVPFSGADFFINEFDKYSQIFGEESMQSEYYCHLKAIDIKRLFYKKGWNWNDYLKIAVVRNPLDRIVNRHFELQKNKPKSEQKPFDEKIQYQLDWVNHQHQWTHDPANKLLVDYVVRYEEIQTDFNFLCNKLKLIKTKLNFPEKYFNSNYLDRYTTNLIEKCEHHHSKDFDVFKFDRANKHHSVLRKISEASHNIRDTLTGDKLDFFTIFFDDECEKNLLLIQAKSFEFVDDALIGKINVLFNENHSIFNKKEILSWYPPNLQKKVNFYSLSDIKELVNVKCKPWHMQQLLKLYIANYITSKNYVVLDAKNHFIRKTQSDTFFDEYGNPKLFLGMPGGMVDCFDKSLKLFDIFNEKDKIESDNENLSKSGHGYGDKHITTTPFVMNTAWVREMMIGVELITNKQFADYFILSTSETEFYIYTAYLYFRKYVSPSMIDNVPCGYLMGGGSVDKWNKPETKQFLVKNNHFKLVATHRNNITDVMDDTQILIMLDYYNKLEVPYLEEIKNFYESRSSNCVH